ncbi:hypothetical protein [Phaeovulum sp. NW3]|uniref:hypothetical protein n=1 Tax=Phaeovulum sp. NW3 TaxID=2934933 RepID=UPI002021FC2A|nr:hypothetical protein [Phaeovulum sp. NW3]MCL7466795.1 hypothetical protein [Phaeovulum sp. NW3]
MVVPTSSQKPRKRSGPQTPEGRKRVSQNARKHGLTSAALPLDLPGIRAAIVAHVGPGRADPLAVARLAEAEALLKRIEEVRLALETELDAFLNARTAPELPASSMPRMVSGYELEEILDDLRIVSRYHAEAYAQRRKAQQVLLVSLTDGVARAEGDFR